MDYIQIRNVSIQILPRKYWSESSNPTATDTTFIFCLVFFHQELTILKAYSGWFPNSNSAFNPEIPSIDQIACFAVAGQDSVIKATQLSVQGGLIRLLYSWHYGQIIQMLVNLPKESSQTYDFHFMIQPCYKTLFLFGSLSDTLLKVGSEFIA